MEATVNEYKWNALWQQCEDFAADTFNEPYQGDNNTNHACKLHIAALTHFCVKKALSGFVSECQGRPDTEFTYHIVLPQFFARHVRKVLQSVRDCTNIDCATRITKLSPIPPSTNFNPEYAGDLLRVTPNTEAAVKLSMTLISHETDTPQMLKAAREITEVKVLPSGEFLSNPDTYTEYEKA